MGFVITVTVCCGRNWYSNDALILAWIRNCTPGVQFLIHANIKASFEYQVRPQQYVTVITNPITGLPEAINAFRTNTAVAGLEFVF